MKTITLYRPINQAELTLIKDLNWNEFPPRLPEQPFFYPVMNEQYAEEITRKWNVPAYRKGFIVKWEIDEVYISKFEVKNVGGHHHNELWVLAEDLDEFNKHIVGEIKLIAEFSE